VSINTEKVKEFYEALSRNDYEALIRLYHPDATYTDELFSFKGKEIHALWYAATRPAMKLEVECLAIEEVNDRVQTKWKMGYTLDVINSRIELEEIGIFVFEGEKIMEHSDEYNFREWCTQAFGIIGTLLGWSSWLRNRVRKQARKSVLIHMYSSQAGNQ